MSVGPLPESEKSLWNENTQAYLFNKIFIFYVNDLDLGTSLFKWRGEIESRGSFYTEQTCKL